MPDIGPYVYVVSSSSYGEQQGVEAVFSDVAMARHYAIGRSREGEKFYVQKWRVDAGLTEHGPYPGLAR